jgi:hypothetical protein
MDAIANGQKRVLLTLMVSRKVQNSRLKIDKLLKSILFYLTLSLKLGFSRSHQPWSQARVRWIMLIYTPILVNIYILNKNWC